MNLLYISKPRPPEVLQGAQPQHGAGGAEGPIGVSLLEQESNRSLFGMVSKIPIRIFSIWEYFSLGREAAMLFETLSNVSSITGKTDIMVLGQGAGTSNSSLNVSEERIIWV